MSRLAQSVIARPRALAAAFAALGMLATAAVLASPVVPASQPSADELQTNVYYDRRDLSTERRTRALYRRIVSAAQEVCPGSDSLSPRVVGASQECQRQAIARAVGQIGNARLAAIDARATSWRG
ncbi:MAG TPA: UrcA family protein [Steroidobacteraceae bacterium]|jgi:UrcA family protein